MLHFIDDPPALGKFKNWRTDVPQKQTLGCVQDSKVRNVKQTSSGNANYPVQL